MKTTILLMRHGAVENPNHLLYERLEGYPLSDEGVRQAEAISKILSEEKIDLCEIISSPLERTKQTAGCVARDRGMDFTIDDRLTEWGVGQWAGRSSKEFFEKSGYYAVPMRMDGMESHEQAAARVISVIDETVERCPGKCVLMVSHRESMASAIMKLRGEDFAGIHDLHMPVASVWELIYDDGEFVSASLKFDTPV